MFSVYIVGFSANGAPPCKVNFNLVGLYKELHKLSDNEADQSSKRGINNYFKGAVFYLGVIKLIFIEDWEQSLK